MRLFTIICLLVLFQFCSRSDANTNHYVDKNATGSNNGSSWANAWQSFSAINWGSIQPGDIIYISGGTDSTIYYERLFVGNVQGTAENRITIRNSWEAGHNGRVIIDGTGLSQGIYIHHSSYITIYGLEVRNAYDNIKVHYWAEYITVDSCLVYDWNDFAIFFAANKPMIPWSQGIGHGIIQNCDFIGKYSGISANGDAIEFNGAYNSIVRNNYIHIRDYSYNNSHSDGIFAQESRGFRIYNNIVICDSNVAGHPYILRAYADATNPETDSVIVYNNFFYSGGLWNTSLNYPNQWYMPAFLFRYQGAPGFTYPPTYAAHNTVVSWGEGVIGVDYESYPTLVNNIIAQFNKGVAGTTALRYVLRGGNIPIDSCRDNLLWQEWDGQLFGDSFTGNGQTIFNPTWAQWVNTLGGTGINENPLFVQTIASTNTGGTNQGDDQATLNGELQSGSPAINAGGDIQALIESMGLPWRYIGEHIEGRLGVTIGAPRPTSSTPTIGAYEVFDNTNGNYIRVHEGWNYISIPKFNNSMIPDSLLPNRTSPVFEYNNGGYQIAHYLQNSKGYIVEFDHSDYIIVDGDSINTPIQVSEGWNLIGPFDKNVPIEQVNSVPPGIIISDFFGYESNRFLSTSMLRIGKGYWVKVSSNGELNLATNPLVKSGVELHTTQPNKDWGMIEINDNKGKSSILYVAEEEIESGFYELPPIPPGGIFDVRYSSGKTVENLKSKKIILINSDDYPINIKTLGVNIRVRDLLNGELLNEEISDGEELSISNSKIKSIEVSGTLEQEIPSSYQLLQNYPNPFNPITSIKFEIPKESIVKLTIYNMLGEEIEILIEEELNPGVYIYRFNASKLSSGIYLYGIKTEDFVATKKMVLLK